MKQEITKYYCDYCGIEMLKHEHEELGVSIYLSIDLPNPKGSCGQGTGYKMTLCKECCKKIGIENTEEYHRYIDSKERLKRSLRINRKSIIDLFTEKFMK